MPGKYFVSMSLVVRGEEKQLFGPVEFNAVVLNNTTLPSANRQEMVEFQQKASQLARTVIGAQKSAEELLKRIDFIRQTVNNSSTAPFELMDRSNKVAKDLSDIIFKFNGSQPPASREEIPPAEVPLVYRLETMINTQYMSTSNVTKNQQVAYDVLYDEIQPVLEKLRQINDFDIKSIQDEMERLGIPWTPGRIPELKK